MDTSASRNYIMLTTFVLVMLCDRHNLNGPATPFGMLNQHYCCSQLQAPMLYCGEHVGDGSNPQVDIAVDPLDGTTLTAQVRAGI